MRSVEGHTGEMAILPDHAALAAGVKIVERQFETLRNVLQFSPNARADVGYVANAADRCAKL